MPDPIRRWPDDATLHADSPVSDDSGVSLLWVTNTILARRRLIFGLPLLLALTVLGITLTRARRYTASTSFTPRSTDMPKSGLGSLAAQFGVAVPGGDPSQSPDFYADLLVSRPILKGVVETRYPTPGTEPRTLVELLQGEGDTPAQRLEDAMQILGSRTSISKNTKTGVLRVAVTTESPTLSVAVTGRMLELVNEFNLRTRRAKAEDEARFAEERVNELAAQLRRAEDDLGEFQQRNRTFRNSPELTLEEQRLNRKVSMTQQVYTSLAQLYEQVRLDALRNTPVITVIEPPELPARPDSRQVVLKTMLALVFGTAFVLALVFAVEVVRSGASAAAHDLSRFRELRSEALADLRNPFRIVFGRRSARR